MATTATSTGTAPDPAPAPAPATSADAEPDAEDPGFFGGIAGRGQEVFRALDRWQRSHRSTAVPYAVFKKFGDDQAGNLAALVAYYAFFSIFPLLLVLVTVTGFVLQDDPEAQQRVLGSALEQFPVVGDDLRENIGSFRGSGVALAVGIVGAVWGGMGALESMQNALNSVWNVPFRKRPNLLKSRLRSITMLVVLGLAVIASTVITGSTAFLDDVPVVGRLLIVPLTLAFNVGMFLVAFKVLTEEDLPWKAMVPGAVVAGVAFSAVQVLGGWYVDRTLRNATQMYGTFAVVIGLLSYLYLQAQLTVLAAEVNVVLHRNLAPRSLTGEDLTDADHRALHDYARVEERLPQEEVAVTVHPEPIHDLDDDGPADDAAATADGDDAEEPSEPLGPAAEGRSALTGDLGTETPAL